MTVSSMQFAISSSKSARFHRWLPNQLSNMVRHWCRTCDQIPQVFPPPYLHTAKTRGNICQAPSPYLVTRST